MSAALLALAAAWLRATPTVDVGAIGRAPSVPFAVVAPLVVVLGTADVAECGFGWVVANT